VGGRLRGQGGEAGTDEYGDQEAGLDHAARSPSALLARFEGSGEQVGEQELPEFDALDGLS